MWKFNSKYVWTRMPKLSMDSTGSIGERVETDLANPSLNVA